jgi:hypothetical protein
VIWKFQFAVPSGITEVPSLEQGGGLTQFLRIRYCQSIVSVTGTVTFPAEQRVFVVEHYFRTQSCVAVKQAYQAHFSDAAVPNK